MNQLPSERNRWKRRIEKVWQLWLLNSSVCVNKVYDLKQVCSQSYWNRGVKPGPSDSIHLISYYMYSTSKIPILNECEVSISSFTWDCERGKYRGNRSDETPANQEWMAGLSTDLLSITPINKVRNSREPRVDGWSLYRFIVNHSDQ